MPRVRSISLRLPTVGSCSAAIRGTTPRPRAVARRRLLPARTPSVSGSAVRASEAPLPAPRRTSARRLLDGARQRPSAPAANRADGPPRVPRGFPTHQGCNMRPRPRRIRKKTFTLELCLNATPSDSVRPIRDCVWEDDGPTIFIDSLCRSKLPVSGAGDREGGRGSVRCLSENEIGRAGLVIGFEVR